ncbi:hypothetical protein [Neosynechococcus sphagnicola]|uniref:hypothetical protein n=1 Tax=Neosynechococcus sphagnicola TaxID=1501145 RepID=UPI0012E0264A|nr:hypothetical protein [Neosynechococcus sphagnicola]
MAYLERHVRTLSNGLKRVYQYAVDPNGERHSLGSTDYPITSKVLYRRPTQKRIVATSG